MTSDVGDSSSLEIPSALKQLARLIARGFYTIEDSLIIDMLVRFPCMREEDLANLLKLDRKMLRSRVATLRTDKYLQTKQRIETDEESKVVKMNCYFINYKTLVNVVKYKLDHMHKKMETSERDATNRSSFVCSNIACGKAFTDLEADQLFDFQFNDFRCTFCSSVVEEDTSGVNSNSANKNSRQQLARFNQQMQKLFDLLRSVDEFGKDAILNWQFDPDPVVFGQDGHMILKPQNNAAKTQAAGGNWSGEASRTNSVFGGGDSDANVKITFNDTSTSSVLNNPQPQSTDSTDPNKSGGKELPAWLKQSTIVDPSQQLQNTDNLHTDKPSDSFLVEQQNSVTTGGGKKGVSGNGDDHLDEIMCMLLKHEKISLSSAPSTTSSSEPHRSSNQDNSALHPSRSAMSSHPNKYYIPGAVDDTTMDDGDTLNAKNQLTDSTSGMSENDCNSLDENGIPKVRVGGRGLLSLSEIDEDIVDEMTESESARWTHIYQHYYAVLYQ